MNTPRIQKVFLSRTTNGLAATAEKAAAILRERGFEVIIQTDFPASWRDVKGMLIDKLIDCDAVICLIGPACGKMMTAAPTGLKDPRTENRCFSYSQLEFLVARDLPRPVFTYLCSGDELIASLAPETPEQEKCQSAFITEFAKDGSNVRATCGTWAKLEKDLREVEIPRTVSAGIRCNLPFSTLGALFVGREDFISDLRQRLTSESGAIIKSHAIHGIGGSGKTRTAIEYAWRHAREHTALLFVNADTPDALKRDLASLCGPLILNLPAQSETDLEKQIHAALHWLENHDDWLLILDNVDSEDAMQAAQNYLAKFRRGKTLITTRVDRVFGDLTPLNLDLLTPDASVELLTVWTRPDSRANDSEKAALRTLADTLGGLALALRQAAAYITEFDIKFTAYLRRYQENTAAALQWHDKSELKYPSELFITYQTSIAQLSPAARELQLCLAWFSHEPIPNTVIEHEIAPADAWRSLTELKNLHLAERHQNGETFSVHKVIQEITRQQQPSTEGQAVKQSGCLGLFLPKRTLMAPPPSLFTALSWIDVILLGDPEDVRTWPTVEALAPHAAAIALSAADCHIPAPTSRLLNEVALLHNTKAQHQTAEPLMRRALAINEAAFDQANVAICLNNLAQLLQATNRLAAAEPLLRRALANNEASLGLDHANVATSLNNLAQLLQATNRHAEAEPLLRRALAINEAFGLDHPNFGTSLNNLATLLKDTNRLAEAEPLIRRGLAIDEASFGCNHPNVARDLNNLARLLHDTCRLAEAEPLLRRALAIDEASFGRDHPNVARDLNNLAQLLQDTSRLEEAEPLMHRALGIHEASFGLDHPNVAIHLSNLAMLLRDTNRRAEAEPLMRRALAIHEASFGLDHPKVATNLSNLAVLLHDTNRLAEAEPLMRRALAIEEASFGPNHPKVASRLNNLAQLLQRTNRLTEAESHMRRTVCIFVSFSVNTGHTHPYLESVIGIYRGLLMEMGDTKEVARDKIGKIMKPLTGLSPT
jgi:tetratricopeptide (TPR) repeat protein